MSSLLASILLPTRGRPKLLARSLASLVRTTRVLEDIEVLVRADDDDVELLQRHAPDLSPASMQLVVGPRGNGYADLHLMYNQLCSLSRGRFLVLWNDDAEMLTRCWDDALRANDDGKLCYLTSSVSDSRGRDSALFPIVHRSCYDALSHLSRSAHNDTYLWNLFSALKPLVYRHTRIVVKHNALELLRQGDTTSLEGQACWPTTKALWGSTEVQQGLLQDIERLQGLLA